MVWSFMLLHNRDTNLLLNKICAIFWNTHIYLWYQKPLNSLIAAKTQFIIREEKAQFNQGRQNNIFFYLEFDRAR